ncbi:MAG: NADH-quinone oxidoreductase subunit C, partial [Candidatus Aureabacteria bacterium]|nr:NADH-quinone oxidoreductase subunit C [Candidatus Auribacterota bacterium]
DSLAPVLKAAEWIEREIHEMLGVRFTGHPNLKRLLLADDMPEGRYPLRRDGENQE